MLGKRERAGALWMTWTGKWGLYLMKQKCKRERTSKVPLTQKLILLDHCQLENWSPASNRCLILCVHEQSFLSWSLFFLIFSFNFPGWVKLLSRLMSPVDSECTNINEWDYFFGPKFRCFLFLLSAVHEGCVIMLWEFTDACSEHNIIDFLSIILTPRTT